MGFLDACIQSFKFCSLLARRRTDDRRRIAVLEIASTVGDVVEVSVEAIELFLGNRVVLVVVATRATHRESEPNRRGGFDTVDGVLNLILIGIGAVLGVAAMVAVESGGDQLVERWVRQLVAGKLLDRELIEWHVAVECLDHPITPAPHVALLIVLVAVGVGVAGGVKPAKSHALAVAR